MREDEEPGGVVVARRSTLVFILLSLLFHLASPFTAEFSSVYISGPQCFRFLSISRYWNDVVGLAASWVAIVELRHSSEIGRLRCLGEGRHDKRGNVQ